MDQSANRLPPTAYGQSVEKLAPRKYRKAKLTIYVLAVLLVGFFVYSQYIKSDSLRLTQPQTAGTNPPAGGPNTSNQPATESNTSYWDKSKIALPSYPPITNSTDLPQATSEINIPDFADQITSLKELIAQ